MNKSKNLKSKNKGITLIALVVTIVVLLILAGISIGALTGDNGIINQAHTAKEDTEIASWEEQIDVAIIDAENKHRNPTLDDIKEELKNKGVIDDYSQVDKDGVITTNEPSYEIAGKLDDYVPFGPGKFATKNEEYTDETSEEEYKTVTVPEGFKILEEASKIDDGLVIEDKKGNQFVWIPVSDINDMAQCSKTDGNCNLELKGNELKCTTHNSTEIVGKLYATDIGENFGTENKTYSPNSGLREPAVVTGNSFGTGTSFDGSSTNLAIIKENYTREDFLEDLKTQYREMATSVARYKGFYVGRYELGLEGDTPVSKNANTDENKDKVVTADASNSNTKSWYGLYKKCLEYTVPEIDNSSVTSTMIWGSQYDAMMNWMQDNNIDIQAEPDGTNTIRNVSAITGAKDKDFLNNIYDLFGCHYEWTLEARSPYERVIRGGYRIDDYSPSRREVGRPTSATNTDSSRLTLYIK